MTLERFIFTSLILVSITACGPSQPTATIVPSSAPPRPSQAPIITPTVTPPPPVVCWTILLYVASDNYLEANALADVNALEAIGGSSAQVNIVLQMDRSPRAKHTTQDWSGSRRYLLQADDNTYYLGSLLLEDLGQVDSSDPERLSDFVAWALDAYPAQRYALIIAGAGNGWPAILFDESDGDAPMTLPELAQALDIALGQSDVEQLDLLGFDASLMGQLEVWHTLAPFAKVGVASQGLLPGEGWDYANSLAALHAQPDMGASSLAQQIVSDLDMEAKYTTLSAVDLGQLGAVTQALDDFSTVLNKDQNAIAAEASIIANSRAITNIPHLPPSQTSAIDLGHWAAWLKANSPRSSVQQAANDLLVALEDFVIANAHGPALPEASGLSIYFPESKLDTDYVRGSLAVETEWKQFLETYYRHIVLELYPPDINIDGFCSKEPDQAVSLHQPACIEFTSEGDILNKVYALVGPETEDKSIEAIAETQAGYATWTAQSAFISDGWLERRAVLWPSRLDSDLVIAQGRYVPENGGSDFDACLVFNQHIGELVSIWALTPAPFELTPSAGDKFQLYDFFLDQQGQLQTRLGERLTLNHWPLTLRWSPAADGDYGITMWTQDQSGRSFLDTAAISVENAELDLDWRGHLDPIAGLYLLYPSDWTDLARYPTNDDAQQIASNSKSGDMALRITTYQSEQSTQEAAAEHMLSRQQNFQDLQVNAPQAYSVAGSQATLIEYDYVKVDKVRYGALAVMSRDGWLYLLDMDATDAVFDDAALLYREILRSCELIKTNGG